MPYSDQAKYNHVELLPSDQAMPGSWLTHDYKTKWYKGKKYRQEGIKFKTAIHKYLGDRKVFTVLIPKTELSGMKTKKTTELIKNSFSKQRIVDVAIGIIIATSLIYLFNKAKDVVLPPKTNTPA